MKLFLVKMKYTSPEGEIIEDAQNLLANNNKELHIRLDEFIDELKLYGFTNCTYQFSETSIVDNFDLTKYLNNYIIENNKIKPIRE